MQAPQDLCWPGSVRKPVHTRGAGAKGENIPHFINRETQLFVGQYKLLNWFLNASGPFTSQIKCLKDCSTKWMSNPMSLLQLKLLFLQHEATPESMKNQFTPLAQWLLRICNLINVLPSPPAFNVNLDFFASHSSNSPIWNSSSLILFYTLYLLFLHWYCYGHRKMN